MTMAETDAADEFVLVTAAAAAADDDEITHEPRVRVLAGGYSEKSLDANYFAAAAAVASRRDAFDNDDEVDDAVANASEGSGDADNDEEVEMVLVEDEQGGGGDHRWQQHVVGVLCSVGLTAATAVAAGLALLLGCGGGGGGGRQKPAVAVNFRASADYKVQMRSSYHESSMTVTKLRAFDNVIR
uniref:Uncharacterized protein n=1 Tax=Oryza glumipatula TaxID=40148 RepID=A0A0E0ALR1_9ORYZ